MGAPKGSKNALGNKGGRRGSAYEEAGRAKMLVDTWWEGIDMKELQEFKDEFFVKGENGKMSINMKSKKKMKLWQLYLLKTISNSKGTELNKMFDRLFPEKVNLGGGLNNTYTVDEHTKVLLEKYKKKK